MSGCRLFNNDDEDNCPPDFGVERISDFPRFNTEEEGIPAWIDKNHLCIRFYDGVGKERADSILSEFGFITRFPQNFNDPLKTCNFVRMVDEPADVFYTTYGDTTSSRLGNRAEVEYAHPAIFLENTEGVPGVLTQSVSVVFFENTSLEERIVFVDSMIAAYNVEPLSNYLSTIDVLRQVRLFISKQSAVGPIELSEKAIGNPLVQSSIYSRGVFIDGLPELDCSGD